MKIILGICIGVFLSFGISAIANSGVTITGDMGTVDFTVMDNGEVVCDDPFISVKLKTIECN